MTTIDSKIEILEDYHNLQWQIMMGVDFFLNDEPQVWGKTTINSDDIDNNKLPPVAAAKTDEVDIETPKKTSTVEPIPEENSILGSDEFKTIESINALDDYLSKQHENASYIEASQRTASHFLLGGGATDANIMIIVPQPLKEDDRNGKFYADAYLNELQSLWNYTKVPCYFTYSVFWRLPGDRVPEEREQLACLPVLKKLINLISPKEILIFGSMPESLYAIIDENSNRHNLQNVKQSFSGVAKKNVWDSFLSISEAYYKT